MDEFLEQFLIEGRELVAQASDNLIALERNPADVGQLESLFRSIHTLKGSVALFDFTPMGSALHVAEDLLDALRSRKSEINSSVIDALLALVDASERWIESIAHSGGLPAGAEQEARDLSNALVSISNALASSKDAPITIAGIATAPQAVTESSARTLRVDATRIDSLVDLVGELIVAKNSLGHLATLATETNSPVADAFVASAAGFERLTNDMHRAVMSLRMTPLSGIFNRFPRWMRDTAGKLGKEVQFEIRDDGVEADKSIVDGLFEPLLHVLRNAVDHGIEDPGTRKSSGKTATGHIILEARQDSDQIIIAVTDDGSGLDPVQLKKSAKLKKLLSEEALNALDDAAASELIFMPGFSTSDAVTDISGRGVGMDAVRTAVAALGGRISITSAPGTGTTVEMILPQAVLATTIVMAEVGEERFGVPIGTITETCRVGRDRILPIRSGEAFVLRNRTLPLVNLRDLLHLPSAERRGSDAKLLIVSSGAQRVGVEVDGFGERLDVLLRPMTGLLSGMPGVVGTALLGNGRVLLVLDLPALIG